METKTCSLCRETKTLDLFYTKLGKPTTLCKVCTLADRARAWRAKHPEPTPWVMPTEQMCTKCFKIKPMDQFHKRASAKDGKQPACAECMTAYSLSWNKRNPEYHNRHAKLYAARHPGRKADIALKTRLGVPWGTYDRLFAEQDGKCAICGTDSTGKMRRFHVDHDGKGDAIRIRGLLCGRCNTGIGQLLHSTTILLAAIKYLERNPK